MVPISVGLTRSRSAVGSMIELGREASLFLAYPSPHAPVVELELALAGVPCLHLKPDPFPFRTAGMLLGVTIADPDRRALH